MTGKSIRILTVILAFLGVLFVVQPAALADQLTLTSAGSTVVGDVLVDPYIATINGVAGQKVICDDFADDTYLQETWTANVSDLAQLSNTSNLRFNVGLTDYEEAAWLAEQLLAGQFSGERANRNLFRNLERVRLSRSPKLPDSQ